jgi:uncharacterized membrane protein YadS
MSRRLILKERVQRLHHSFQQSCAFVIASLLGVEIRIFGWAPKTSTTGTNFSKKSWLRDMQRPTYAAQA